MFSLIITIISIALVAALAVATIYYGGSAFTNGSAKAAASTVVAHAQQITGANTLYANDNNGTFNAVITGTGSLVAGGYLASAPAIPANVTSEAISTSNLFTAVGASNAVCLALNNLVAGTTQMTNSGVTAPCTFTYQG